ncbi:MAG TPA: L-seryl-tRNA(Sec) selenium transferase [Thermoanaerobaculia bacterium]|nr:L-seryl-tRNA(Sec) selenium transferase [Thermoanaerobaculia bacterium]
MSRTRRTPAAAPSAAPDENAALRRIPSVEKLLSSAPFGPLLARWGRSDVKQELAGQLDAFRRQPGTIQADAGAIADLVVARLERALAPSLRPVINATGIIIHTNLGRSPLGPDLLRGASGALTGYANLEFDLDEGARGKRDEHVAELAARLFGCESALLVNNNASAVLLLLAATARDREVIVSRGELVEIGGSFRVPEVITQGGAILREVGTTNRTRASDYAAAVRPETAAMLRVHRSNFEIVGFTESPELGELVEVARSKGVPLFYDEGSGRVVDLARYGFSSAPVLRELVSTGIDAITCSTDKLIGATQGGLILGTRAVIDACARHPLMRALRAGKESYAIVGETLRAFLAERQEELVPIYAMLAAPLEGIRARAERIAARVAGASVRETRAALGGGTTPSETIASAGVALPAPRGADALRSALLRRPRPVVTRIESDEVIVDLRTVAPDDDETISDSIAAVLEDRA